MAIASVQTTSGAGVGAAITTAAFAGNTTSGNLIVVCIASSANFANNVKSVTDSGSANNVYQKVGSLLFGGSSNIDIWYCPNITGGTTPTVTANVTTTSGQGGVIAREFSGLASVPLNGYHFLGQSSVAIHSSASAGRSQSNVLIFGATNYASSTAAPTLGSGFTNLTTLAAGINIHGIEEQIVAVPGEYAATFGTSSGSTQAVTGVAIFSDTNASAPYLLNNYQFLRAGDGVSVSEKIR